MGVFRQFPYSNFHEMNLDEMIKIIKNMLEEWAQYYAEWNTWMDQMNDDWSNYQEVMNEAWQNMQDFINNYFDNLDVQEEINTKITSMVNSGVFASIVAPYIPPEVSTWLSAHITQPTGVVIDTSLTVAGACADAKSTGDAIDKVKSAIGYLNATGNLDFVNGQATFYDGYYSATAYVGGGTIATPPFTDWNVLVMHVIKDAKIKVSGFPATNGVRSAWLNSANPADFHSVAWLSTDNNTGTKICETEWLAIADYRINPDNIKVVYEMNAHFETSIEILESQMQTLYNRISWTGTAYGDVDIPIKITSGHSYEFKCIGSSGYVKIMGSDRTVIVNTITAGFSAVWTADADYDYITVLFSGAGVTLEATDNSTPISDLLKAKQDIATISDGKYMVLNDAIGRQITKENCTFITLCRQYIDSNNLTTGGYWDDVGGIVQERTLETLSRVPAIELKAGTSYSFIHVYGYFCIITDNSGTVIERLTTSTANDYTGNYTPATDCYVYVTIFNTAIGSAMVCDSVDHLPKQYVEGVYYEKADLNTGDGIDITVKKDGSGDYSSIVDAVEYANSQGGRIPINIHIYSGDYDILDELGGNTFINSILDNGDVLQGLCLKADGINLIGHGYVIMRFELPDTVQKFQSTNTSCLNLTFYSNKIENITLIAKNCRYVIHDECGPRNPYIHRVMKNLRCIHKGNAEGLWEWATVMGGGAGGGSTYDIINCQFITGSYFQAFSYHTNTNQQPSFFNVDGCVGSVNNNTSMGNGISFRFAYYGTGRTGICVANVKNCSGNGRTVVESEQGSTNNNIEMYVNGWETIEPITVTGNE